MSIRLTNQPPTFEDPDSIKIGQLVVSSWHNAPQHWGKTGVIVDRGGSHHEYYTYDADFRVKWDEDSGIPHEWFDYRYLGPCLTPTLDEVLNEYTIE